MEFCRTRLQTVMISRGGRGRGVLVASERRPAYVSAGEGGELHERSEFDSFRLELNL